MIRADITDIFQSEAFNECKSLFHHYDYTDLVFHATESKEFMKVEFVDTLNTISCHRFDLANLYFVECNFENFYFYHLKGERLFFEKCTFKHCKLAYGILERCNFTDCNFIECDFYSCKMTVCHTQNSTFMQTPIISSSFEMCTHCNIKIDDSLMKALIFKENTLRTIEINDTELDNICRLQSSCHSLTGNSIKSANEILNQYFEYTKDGLIAYKTFDMYFSKPDNWILKPGSIISEHCDSNRTQLCGSGINVAPLTWVRQAVINKQNSLAEQMITADFSIWQVLIRWEWLAGVVVPYSTDGKIRCERCELVEVVER